MDVIKQCNLAEAKGKWKGKMNLKKLSKLASLLPDRVMTSGKDEKATPNMTPQLPFTV